ncbi:MAG: ABC transporter ATP-binding protein, partial [Erysipelotrichaceae bacterium]
MIKRFISYYKPHKCLFAFDMIASFLVSLIGMLYPVITRVMLNDLIPNKKVQLIVTFGGLLLVLYIMRMGLRYFIQYYGHMIGVRMQAQMRKDMFNKLQKLPYAFYDEHESGKIMSRMTNDLMDVSELAHHGPENILISLVMIMGSFFYLLSINVSLTLIIFMCVPLLVVVATILRKRMRDAFMETRKDIAVVNSALQSSISGIRVTKAFTNDLEEEKKFNVGNMKFVQSRSYAYKAMALFYSSTNLITDVFNVIVLIAGGLYLYQNKISFGDYSAFIVSVNLFVQPVMTLIQFSEQYQSGMTGFERFVEIMDQEEEKESENCQNIAQLQGDINFQHVSFNYNYGQEVLKDVNLTINKGETLALVGPSGGGKTTICHLLPMFYQINEGSITIDGKDIRDISLVSLRKNIGIVQQDVFLFNGTIKENILYGRLDASDEEVIQAAKDANIYDYIMSLPEKFETQIGERGVKLSGGQKQRLSISRVFLKNPPILILDEATSALDNTTEILIQNSLDKLAMGRSVIVVAHRLSTIKNANKIAVIDQGQT